MTQNRKGSALLIVFLGLMSAMAPLATDMYLPALPEVQKSFAMDASMAQLTLTMTLLGMSCGQIFIGSLSDHWGRKRPLLIGMIVFTLATIGCILATNIGLFLTFRALQGFSGASGIVIARAIARDVAEGVELTRFFSILMMVNGLAPIMAPVLGGEILAFFPWRGVFVALFFVGLLQILQVIFFRETLPPEKRLASVARSIRAYPMLLTNRYFFGHCLLQCFAFAGFFSYIAGSSFVFQDIYKLSAQTYSYIFGTIGSGLLLIGFLPARLAGRVKDETMLKYALLVSLLSGLLLLIAFIVGQPPLLLTIGLIFCNVVPLAVTGSASFSLALSRQGKNAGSASALVGFFSMFLGGLLMPLVGVLGTSSALPMATLMFTGALFAFLAFLRYVRGA